MERSRARDDVNLHIVSILHEAGAPLLLGTDTANPHVYQGFSLHQELANFVRAGLSPYETLCCGTSEAARFLGETALWGTIAVGKRADLLLTRANPLADVAAVRDLEAVFVNGYCLTHNDLDALMEQRVACVQDFHTLVPAELDLVDGEGQVIQQGTWSEDLDGIEGDRVAYRHRKFEDGTLLIEERYASTRRSQRSTVRLEVKPDATISRGGVRIESLAGETSRTIVQSDTDTYAVHQQEMDGHESFAMLDTAVFAPAGLLAVTAVPLLLAKYAQAGKEVVLPTLSIDPDGV